MAWCPNGNASGGICRPANNHRERWMERYTGVRVLPIGEALLLGTHHSGFDKKAPRTPSSETCQDVPVYDQLMWGVRVLDLRVSFYSGARGHKRFAIYHGTTSGRYVETDIIGSLLKFRRDAQAHKEIVILNFHQFRDFTDAAHLELAGVIKRLLGRSIVPPSCRDAAIVQLWELNKNTVVSYNRGQRDSSFWAGVEQRWIGGNTPGKDAMASFINQVGGEFKAFGALRSIQAAYYSKPFFVPKDLSGDLMSWFAATSTGGPIQSHYIINTDWSLRQRLADNIIYGNGVRAKQRGAHVIVSSPASEGGVVQTSSCGIYRMSLGNWTASLTFAPNLAQTPSIQVVGNDARGASEIKWGSGQRRVIYQGDRVLFKVDPGKAPRLLEVFSAA